MFGDYFSSGLNLVQVNILHEWNSPVLLQNFPRLIITGPFVTISCLVITVIRPLSVVPCNARLAIILRCSAALVSLQPPKSPLESTHACFLYSSFFGLPVFTLFKWLWSMTSDDQMLTNWSTTATSLNSILTMHLFTLSKSVRVCFPLKQAALLILPSQ